jgi:hypothetical protein
MVGSAVALIPSGYWLFEGAINVIPLVTCELGFVITVTGIFFLHWLSDRSKAICEKLE